MNEHSTATSAILKVRRERIIMKLIPVFLPSHEIIGYLADDQIPRVQYETRTSFRLPAAPVLMPTSFNWQSNAPVAVDIHSVMFDWEAIGSVRGADDLYQEQGCHRAFVLMVGHNNFSYMGRVRGFRWFAEVEGQQV
jgi:hypothetical protein